MSIKILFISLLLFTHLNVQSQDEGYSPKLEEDHGIGKFEFSTPMKALPNYYVELKEKAFNPEYGSPSRCWEINPVKADLSSLYGLPISGIEAWTVMSEMESEDGMFVLSVLKILIEIPDTQEELDLFYTQFRNAYEPRIEMITWNTQGQTCNQWLTDYMDCGILMSLPQNQEFTLEELKEKKIETLELKLVKGC